MSCLYWPGVLVIHQSSRHSLLLTGEVPDTMREKFLSNKNVTMDSDDGEELASPHLKEMTFSTVVACVG